MLGGSFNDMYVNLCMLIYMANIYIKIFDHFNDKIALKMFEGVPLPHISNQKLPMLIITRFPSLAKGSTNTWRALGDPIGAPRGPSCLPAKEGNRMLWGWLVQQSLSSQ